MPFTASKHEHHYVGMVLGKRFQIQSVLQVGGIGTLFLALDHASNQYVAIKTLRVHDLNPRTQALFRRFQREGEILSICNHPCIVKVVAYDFFDEVFPYIAMEYIEGFTLREYLARFPLGMPVDRFILFMKQLCSAVNRIHLRGIIHRDIKPGNMMVQPKGDRLRLKLLDFGLILIERTIGPDATTRLTQKGQILGTPAYMSPEQCRGEAVTQESDIYNLGLIAYEILVGHPAVEGTTVQKLIDHQVEKMPVPVHEKRADIPIHISEAIQRALDKAASKRWHSARDFWLAMAEPATQCEFNQDH